MVKALKVAIVSFFITTALLIGAFVVARLFGLLPLWYYEYELILLQGLK